MWVCPKCERTLKSPNIWHDCVKVSLDTLMEGKNPALVPLLDSLLAELMDWQGVAVSATTNCIVFIRNKTFLIIRPMKKELDLKFTLPDKIEDEAIFKTMANGGKWIHHVRLKEIDEVEGSLLGWLKKAYDLS